MPESADFFTLVRCPCRLRAIFKHEQFVFFGDMHNDVHICGITVQMNGQNHLCLLCDRALDQLRVNVVCLLINVDKNWRCPRKANGRDGRRGRVGDCNHFIPRSDTKRAKGQIESVGAGVDTNNVSGA